MLKKKELTPAQRAEVAEKQERVRAEAQAEARPAVRRTVKITGVHDHGETVTVDGEVGGKAGSVRLQRSDLNALETVAERQRYAAQHLVISIELDAPPRIPEGLDLRGSVAL